MSILQARNVHYIYQSKYQKVHAVKGIDFEFEEGKFYAIVGKSGCGKTTFLSLLAGLDLPTEGQIVYSDKSTAERNRDEYRLRAISLICQSYNLFPLLTVEENVIYPMLLRGVKENDAKYITHKKLKDVGLGDTYYRRLPAMLSGGEQQRVAIARALVNRPSILLADEPTGNLDPKNSWEIMKLLEQINENGTTVLVVTHNREIVNAMQKRVVTMKKGVIVSDEEKGGYIDDED